MQKSLCRRSSAESREWMKISSRELPFGQCVVVIPHSQLDSVLPKDAKGGGRSIMLPQAFEELAAYVALYEQALSRDEVLGLVLQEGIHKALQLPPEIVVEGVTTLCFGILNRLTAPRRRKSSR
jgi:hypothetical protein